MDLGRTQILLGILVLCGVVYVGMSFFGVGRNSCGPIPLSHDIKIYIDKQLATAPNSGQGGDLTSLQSRIAQVEAKMEDVKKYEALRTGLAEKSNELNRAVEAARRQESDLLTSVRNEEIARLRNEMATMCAGVTFRKSPVPAAGAKKDDDGPASQ